MHKTRPGPWSYIALGGATTATLGLIVARYVILFTLPPSQLRDAVVATTILAAIAGTAILGWRVIVRSGEAERDELRHEINELRERVTAAEDQAWWGETSDAAPPAVPAAGGDNVVPLRHAEWARTS